MDRGAKLLMVPPIEVPSDDEVEATMPPVLAGGEPESLPKLEVSEDMDAPLSGCSVRVIGITSPSGTAGESLMLSWERPTENSPFELYLWREDVDATLNMGIS